MVGKRMQPCKYANRGEIILFIIYLLSIHGLIALRLSQIKELNSTKSQQGKSAKFIGASQIG